MDGEEEEIGVYREERKFGAGDDDGECSVAVVYHLVINVVI